ncbi:MAG: type IV pilus secretin PilQ [Candidatus Omnitrophica bacterium]|nr:type IV pilus secretin PilQ [Candidatus Omnitrophota bacterium]MDD5080845.1 type IV pilus secretin PilQ [Candidatus Omnitrophota bacterium]
MKKLFFLMILMLCGIVYAQDGIISSIKFKDADIALVLKAVASNAYKDGKKINIVKSPSVQAVVDVDLEGVDWQTALKVILKAHDFGYEWVGDSIILVAPFEELAQQRQKEALALEEEALRMKTFILSYAKVSDLSETIKGLLSDRGKMTTDTRSNAVVITDTQASLENIERNIVILDKMTQQVMIEVKIVETNLNKEENLGIKWDLNISASGSKRPTTFPWTTDSAGSKYFPLVEYPSSILTEEETTVDTSSGYSSTSTTQTVLNSLAAGFPQVSDGDFAYGTIDATGLGVALEALKARSGTEIVSNPKIMTMDNSPATIKVATEWPIPKYSFNQETGSWTITGFEFKPIGVNLSVIPQINNKGFITMEIVPEISEVTGEIAFDSGGATLPLIDTQTSSTKVMVKDGETLVIGGLIKDKTGDSSQKVPILGDIPLIGRLFTYKSKTEEKKDLLIFLTPRIISAEGNK